MSEIVIQVKMQNNSDYNCFFDSVKCKSFNGKEFEIMQIMQMAKLKDIIISSEDILMEKILDYAKKFNYVKYTSTLIEAWRLSISGLSRALISAIDDSDNIPEMNPDENYTKNKFAQFGIIEARKHRSRGVSLGMFLGFMKYYQQAYADLIQEKNLLQEEKEYYLLYIKRYFDNMEIGFITEWATLSEEKNLQDLQEANRNITNEKNRYITIFESIYDPIILVDKNNKIENLNNRAAEIFLKTSVSENKYYRNKDNAIRMDWLKQELKEFIQENNDEVILEKALKTKTGIRTYSIKFKKLMDYSEKYSGTVIIFNDITQRLEFDRQLEAQYKKLEYYAYTDPLTGVLNRRTGLITLEKELTLLVNRGIPMSICFIDIDGLKYVNDNYGHDEGDNLIRYISSMLEASVRTIDSVSRLGGDEFLLIFPDCSEALTENVMKRVLKKLQSYDKKKEKPYKHEFSYGIVEMPMDQVMNATDMIKLADRKMYQQKQQKKHLAE